MKFQPVEVELPDRGIVFRSLRPEDLDALGSFYRGLSDRTRAFRHRRADAENLRFYEREGFSEAGRTGSVIDMVRAI